MNKKVYHILEYDKIIEMLALRATSEDGIAFCKKLEPMREIGRITRAQQETHDALSRLLRKGSISFAGMKNPNAMLKRLEMGGVLNAAELLQVGRLLEVARKAKAYGREGRDDLPADSLQGLFDGLEPCTLLAEEIRRCIIAEDEISDEASSSLRQIRRTIHGIHDRIRSSLQQIVNSNAGRTYLQDALITMRHGRYCIPVKAEHKADVPGMVHDQSASGSTLFVEPMAVVKLNNDLREAFGKEAEEIDRILAELSVQTNEYAASLEADFRILKELDFIFAKGKLALDQNAMRPEFNEKGILKIRKGRHPLLDSKKAVPIDVYLGEEFRVLVVTGPNTGGKTVSLKTVGLFALMGQAGLHIPAGDRSMLPVFRKIYADIGDEQSIEQSLSTFSSHMTNIVNILKGANADSLVLFDELCAGTDPEEGAALAVSILESLRERGSMTMATTHYSELKLYALGTEGVENACCEFDVETLSPTYHLLIGIPGKSNAFAISEKIGLPKELIEEARGRISQETESFEDVIADLETSRRKLEKDQEQIQAYREEMERLKQQLDEQKSRLQERKDKIIREANEEAAGILREAKEVADTTIRNFHKYGAGNADMAAMEREREAVRKKMQKAGQKASLRQTESVQNHTAPDPKKLRIGDDVKVLSMNQKGVVHTLPDKKGDLMVQMGILRYKVNIRDLALIADVNPYAVKKKKSGGSGNKSAMGQLKMSKSANVSAELNLIGKTVDEAIPLLDKYLDDAYLAHLNSVRIVHGKGTGALRNAVHAHLKRQKYVADYHLGAYGEGDAGVTIVTFS